MADSIRNLKFKALKCMTCSSPVYYDTTQNGFQCTYCGQVTPYAGDDGVAETEFHIDHRPLEQSDGRYYMDHLGKVRDMTYGNCGQTDKNWQYIIKQQYLNRSNTPAYGKRELFIHNCTMCGAQVEAFATQNVWNCAYCNNKFIKEGLLASQKISSYEVIDTNDDLMPHFAIPFTISKKEAKSIIIDFASLRPNAFKEQRLEERTNELIAFYVPYRICDASIIAEVSTEHGDVLLFRDYVNWVTTLTHDHNYHMLNEIGPWDLSKIVPFSPKYAEGDILLDKAYAPDSSPALFVTEIILRPELISRSKALFPGKRHAVRWIQEDLRTVRTAMLPVYFLDRMSNGSKAFFMVNGQTGAISVFGRGQMAGAQTLFAPGRISAEQMIETTISSELEPVKQESWGVFKRVSAKEAWVEYNPISSSFQDTR